MQFIGTNAELIEKVKEGLGINDEDLWEMLRNPPHENMKEYALYHMLRYELWEEYAQNHRTMKLFYRLRTRLQRRNAIKKPIKKQGRKCLVVMPHQSCILEYKKGDGINV